MAFKSLCNTCHKNITDNQRAIQCDLCNSWVHAKCTHINAYSYNLLSNDSSDFYCHSCLSKSMAFSSISNLELKSTLLCKNIPTSSLNSFETPSNHKKIFKDLNKFPSSVNCKYYDVIDLNKTMLPNSELYIHLNIASLPFHIDELCSLINSLNNFRLAIGITESNLYINDTNITDIYINGFNIEHCPTEAKKGGALLYLRSNLNYVVRNDLMIYSSKYLESIFVEIEKPCESNIIIGCIYRHPLMNQHEFTSSHLTPLLEKLSNEKKKIFQMGDFNMDLLSHNESNPVSTYLDSLTSYSLSPSIILPSRITATSKTLIDNIFTNFHSTDQYSGNLTISTSDHMAQFICIPGIPKHPKKVKTYRRCLKKFNKSLFIKEISNINWELSIKKDDDVNKSMVFILKIFDEILDLHAPYKILTNQQIKLKSKPWITYGILKSISVKNKLYKKFIKLKNIYKKNELFTKFKFYRNKISNLLKFSKKTYYITYFHNNLNSVKNTWKGIKEIINIRPSTHNTSFKLKLNENLITDHTAVSNIFNNFFSTIHNKLLSKAIPPKRVFSDFLNIPNAKSFFINPVTENEISGLITNKLKTEKSLGPNSVPTFLLKLVPHIISKPLCTVINNSFKSGIFPDIFKVAKLFQYLKKALY
ncbi:uncharacterized protein LOC136074109 [Hydra vulgaris]|uniref:Uncharacterized protein LOC136074109 n=1 Tax=Hydra vulgaris TaxID=6087 RepID=A0ABM4B164_HYDVU